jgi:FeS assembly SUF system protein
MPKSIKDNIIKNLHSVYDPEIPVDIYELGLIYDLKVHSEGLVNITMTLTSPNCPVAEILPEQVKKAAQKTKGVKDVNLKLVFDPPWNPDMMSEAAKVELNMG